MGMGMGIGTWVGVASASAVMSAGAQKARLPTDVGTPFLGVDSNRGHHPPPNHPTPTIPSQPFGAFCILNPTVGRADSHLLWGRGWVGDLHRH